MGNVPPWPRLSDNLALVERLKLALKVMTDSGSPMLKARAPLILDPPERRGLTCA